MKYQKLLVITAIVCLLMGASVAAMATDIICTDMGNPAEAVLINELVEGTVSVTGNCIIENSVILGNVTATLERNEVLVLLRSVVMGQVKVTGGSAAIDNNILPGGSGGNRIVIKRIDNDTVVSDNLIQGPGNIVVRGSDLESAIVAIYSNTVINGDIRCVGNVSQDTSGVDTDAFAYDNVVPAGVVTCFGQ